MEPTISGPITHSGSPFGWGLLLSRGRYLPKNWTRSAKPFARNQHTWQNWAPWGTLGPIAAHLGGRSGSNLAGMFLLSRGVLVPNFIAIARSWPIPPIEPKISGPITPLWGWGVPLWGGGCRCPGVGTYLKWTQSVHASGQGSRVSRTHGARTFSG